MEEPKLKLSKEDKTDIAAEMAGIILGRILRALIIIVGMMGLLFAGYMSAAMPAAETVEKVEPVKAAKKKIIKKTKKAVDKPAAKVHTDFVLKANWVGPRD